MQLTKPPAHLQNFLAIIPPSCEYNTPRPYLRLGVKSPPHLRPIFLKLTAGLYWSYLDVQVYLAKMRGALRDRRIHAYHTCFHVRWTLAALTCSCIESSSISGRKNCPVSDACPPLQLVPTPDIVAGSRHTTSSQNQAHTSSLHICLVSCLLYEVDPPNCR